MAKSAKPLRLRIEYVDPKTLSPYPSNPKVHSRVQVERLDHSMTQFGFINPILLDGKGVIIAGHGRWEAALKREEPVPVIRLAHLSEEQARALRVADNSLAQAGSSWNVDLLEAELAQLRAVEYPLEPIGLDAIELPEIEEVVEPPRKANRSKTTLFVSVANAQAEKARKLIVTALDKARIPHNL